jgi:hypothetical protein
MSLSYYYAFSARYTTLASELEDFLQAVAVEARAMGFDPVLVLNSVFDTAERRKFARLLTTGARLESKKLRGVVLLRDGQVWSHDNVNGSCRVIPRRGVTLTVTDEKKRESVFGFLQFPAALVDLNGKVVVKTDLGNRWTYQSFVNSPDERYRKIVKRFAEAGFLDLEKDEFADSKR